MLWLLLSSLAVSKGTGIESPAKLGRLAVLRDGGPELDATSWRLTARVTGSSALLLLCVVSVGVVASTPGTRGRGERGEGTKTKLLTRASELAAFALA